MILSDNLFATQEEVYWASRAVADVKRRLSEAHTDADSSALLAAVSALCKACTALLTTAIKWRQDQLTETQQEQRTDIVGDMHVLIELAREERAIYKSNGSKATLDETATILTAVAEIEYRIARKAEQLARDILSSRGNTEAPAPVCVVLH